MMDPLPAHGLVLLCITERGNTTVGGITNVSAALVLRKFVITDIPAALVRMTSPSPYCPSGSMCYERP